MAERDAKYVGDLGRGLFRLSRPWWARLRDPRIDTWGHAQVVEHPGGTRQRADALRVLSGGPTALVTALLVAVGCTTAPKPNNDALHATDGPSSKTAGTIFAPGSVVVNGTVEPTNCRAIRDGFATLTVAMDMQAATRALIDVDSVNVPAEVKSAEIRVVTYAGKIDQYTSPDAAAAARKTIDDWVDKVCPKA